MVGAIKKPGSVYADQSDEQNPFEGQRVRFVENSEDEINADGVPGHLISVSTEDGENEVSHTRNKSFYERYTKRCLDIVLSGLGLILLSPVFLVISVAVYIDDPGPVLFTQKRVGKDKQFFRLHKFRSMRMDTPHDVPTHELREPEKYITRVGAVLRRTSLDELPQIWDIWLGNMSVIGPRPALWNQDKLTALRDGGDRISTSTHSIDCLSADGAGDAVDKVDREPDIDANSVTPGLTGLAQIKGRDELELEDKAALDREYTANISFATDIKCFFGTIKSVLQHDGVVEGGAGEIEKGN